MKGVHIQNRDVIYVPDIPSNPTKSKKIDDYPPEV